MNVAYVPIPKDLTKVRQKLILNLTKRQVICFSGGALIGVPLFFLTKNAAARQHGDVSYDLCHDAVFRAWPV